MRPALTFAAVLGGLVASTYAAWLGVPGLAGRIRHISLAERPPGADYYLAHDRGGHLDHHVLYHAVDPVAMRHLRDADVLFVGTSRMMFALRPSVLSPWASANGLTYYALGFGHRDGDEWVLEIIRRHDLRPKLVVANVDGFFGQPRSSWANRVRRDSRFGAVKLQIEGEAGHEARRAIHRVMPNWIDLYGRPGFPFGNEFIAYRSRENGAWQVSPWPEASMDAPAEDFAVEAVGERIASPARAFKAELDRRGAQLVLTHVPTPDRGAGNPVSLGSLLGVPVVGMDVDGLTSHDGSHLSEESALAWSRRLTQDLQRYLPGAR
ncbi:MAG TPA: hypothetical protein VEA16_19275 [Vicinamibacterales bacterium]|nr:hypothetical protein [Vicinamibacterales bacterium]